MHWKSHLTQQLVGNNWFIADHCVQAALVELAYLLNPESDFSNISKDILSVTSPIPQIAATHDDYDISDGYDALPEGSIAIFRISGTLFKSGTYWSYGTEEIGEQMVAAAKHPNIAAGLFIGDSGGGGVNAVAPLRRGFKGFKSAGKPIGSLMDSACSAMYYGIAESDFIMAQNDISAIFGSIGVMYPYMDIKEYLEKLGVKMLSYYPDESSEKNLAFRELEEGKPERLKKEELAPLAVKFRDTMVIDRGPKLKVIENPKILLGKTYNATDSITNGLIDSIGDKEAAIQLLLNHIQIKKYLNSKQ